MRRRIKGRDGGAGHFLIGGTSLHTYLVPVRNEDTGEVRIVEVLSGYAVDAQVEALQQLFKHEGWRKATALLPDVTAIEQSA